MNEINALDPIKPAELRDLREVAYRHLRQGIVSGVLRGGMQINERELAARLGISTTPVKDALRRLEAEGAVITLPRKGSFIAHFTPDLLHEFTLVRAALEGVAARLAAERAGRSAGAEPIVSALDQMRSRTSVDDVAGLVLANERFHDEVRKLANSEYLARMLESLRVYDQVARTKILTDADERQTALVEHELVADAILRGDAQAAEESMREHVLRSSGSAADSCDPQSDGAGKS